MVSIPSTLPSTTATTLPTIPLRCEVFFLKAQVYCLMSVDGGGYTLMSDPAGTAESDTFGYEDYINGIGQVVVRDKWLGLDLIHGFTNSQETRQDSLEKNTFLVFVSTSRSQTQTKRSRSTILKSLSATAPSTTGSSYLRWKLRGSLHDSGILHWLELRSVDYVDSVTGRPGILHLRQGQRKQL